MPKTRLPRFQFGLQITLVLCLGLVVGYGWLGHRSADTAPPAAAVSLVTHTQEGSDAAAPPAGAETDTQPAGDAETDSEADTQSPGAQSPGAQSPGAQSPGAQSPGAESPGDGEEADPAAAEDPELPEWIARIDSFFGTYLVAPLEFVLFFDFWTSDWLGVSVPFVVIWLMAGAIFFTLRMGFINFRAFRHAILLIRGDYDDPDDEGEVSHFQALASALSATVGLGNIAGVAIAIGAGGPVATFWMVVMGLLGMSTKFTECSLGQMYRKVLPDGTVLGGPMQYLKDGLAEKGVKPLGILLAGLFTILCIGASFGGGNAFQVVQSLSAIKSEIPILQTYPWIYGLVLAFLVGIVIIGGIRSIGAVAGRIVPFMCAAYVLAALYILVRNAVHIPDAISLIISGAFSPEAMYGGFLGVMVQGVRRAVFSNEAGAGSAAIAHSAAKTNEPISEGIVALMEPFIDTVVVCTMTALVVVITGVYSPEGPNAAAIQEIIDRNQGAALTSMAFTQGGHEWFKWILNAAVVLFAYSTLISWSYYGERCWTLLFGYRSSIVYKMVYLVFTFLGSIVTATNILAFSDLLILGMAFPNILGVVILSGNVKRRLDDYWSRYKAGKLTVTKR